MYIQYTPVSQFCVTTLRHLCQVIMSVEGDQCQGHPLENTEKCQIMLLAKQVKMYSIVMENTL